MMQQLFSDFRVAVRVLSKSRGFCLTVILILGPAIATNIAAFTVVNTVLLHPLPYPQSERIVSVSREGGGSSSVPMFNYWIGNNLGLEDLSGYQGDITTTITGSDRPEVADAMKVSDSYFRLTGANLRLGRTFTSGENKPGGGQVCMISYGLWQRRFAGDPSIAGKTVLLAGFPYQVVGVLASGFISYPPSDIWMPLQADPSSTDQAHVISVAGRLPRGMTLPEANSRMKLIGKQYADSHPAQLGNDDRMEVTLLEDQIVGDARRSLLILTMGVALVLLIACANLATMLLARATIREKEISIRLALGSARSRIIRQLLIESILLAGTAGVLGFAAGALGIHGLLAVMPVEIPRIQELQLNPAVDLRVAAFAILLSVTTGIGFGLFPALRLSRRDLSSSLQRSGGTRIAGGKSERTRRLLTSAEVAIAMVLMCGALLLTRSFLALHHVNSGFNARDVLAMEVSLTGPRYAKGADVDRFQQQVLDKIQQIPGVETVAMASALPLSNRMDMIFDIPGRPTEEGRKFAGDVMWLFVSAHYFDVLRIPVIAGTLFDQQAPGQRAVVISQAMARKYWPGRSPVGQVIHIGPGLGSNDQGMVEVIGVVGDVRDRLHTKPSPVMYQTVSQISDSAIGLVHRMQPGGILVRTVPGSSAKVASDVEKALLAGESLPVSRSRTLEQLALASLARENVSALLLGLFAAFALLLAAAGIYAVMSYDIAQRRHEIAIRATIGAGRGNIFWLVLSQALKLTFIGASIGIVASVWLTQFMRTELFETSPLDSFTFGAAPLILFAVAVVAGFLPALRACWIVPSVGLLQE